MLSKIIGNNINIIQRKSYCIPIKKEGTTSQKEIPDGLKAIKVTILNMLNIRRKMTSRFVTHKIVFGILNLDSIKITCYTRRQKEYKRIEFKPFQQKPLLYLTAFCSRVLSCFHYFCSHVFFSNYSLGKTTASGP